MKQFFNFRSIKVKMLFSFSIVLFLVVALGVLSFLAVDSVKNNINYLAEEEVPLMTLDEELAHNTAVKLTTIRGYML
ncbi:MAG TPA: hypothetical protein VK067_04775 [Pseudogracilibacillus sp.]|nr:hypothetical protein [Pseudogracilibacillus sp.]